MPTCGGGTASGSGGGNAGGKVYGGQYGTITEKSIDELQSMGAKRWTKNGHDRLYLSGAGAKIMGLEVSTYKSGNISSATLNGEGISNSEALRIMSAYSNAYIDLQTGSIRDINKFGGRQEYREMFVDKMSKWRKKK
ncbi:MAG: hypothetical protein IJ740_08560 [Ruminococcus sp.]|nr:hypothetical protein [Ruminococcus sp.]